MTLSEGTSSVFLAKRELLAESAPFPRERQLVGVGVFGPWVVVPGELYEGRCDVAASRQASSASGSADGLTRPAAACKS